MCIYKICLTSTCQDRLHIILKRMKILETAFAGLLFHPGAVIYVATHLMSPFHTFSAYTVNTLGWGGLGLHQQSPLLRLMCSLEWKHRATHADFRLSPCSLRPCKKQGSWSCGESYMNVYLYAMHTFPTNACRSRVMLASMISLSAVCIHCLS